MIVLAGPNGCGKSAALDALRLLKSVYGGYQENEWQTWMGEFQIDMSRPDSLTKLLRRPAEPARIAARLTLHDDERRYLVDCAESVAREVAWQELFRGTRASYLLAADAQAHAPRVVQRTAEVKSQLAVFRDVSSFDLSLVITPGRPLDVSECRGMEIVFKTYDPVHVGVMDFHSASRSYVRESLGGINLDIAQYQQQRQQHLLYNSQSKYANVKTELASEYLRTLIAQEADGESQPDDLNTTLTELFARFFPDKRYLGPRPQNDGTVTFPVLLADGSEHDLDELSSGEKEILYGYLRLRNAAARYSVIMLDEPELHLNPGLLRGLPDFYHEKIGRARHNQLWLVTHSDALLREAVRNPEMSVFHVRTATSTTSGESQAQPIRVETAIEEAVIDLVGDLATYKPHGDVIICESEGEAAFDVAMISRLFPDVAARANIVAGGSRKRVQDLYSILGHVGPTIGRRFCAIVDRDAAPPSLPKNANFRHWDRYHIENYLLEPAVVLQAVSAVSPDSTLADEVAVAEALRDAAAAVVPVVLRAQLISYANDRLVREIKIGAAAGRDSSIAESLRASIEGSVKRFEKQARALIDANELSEEEKRGRAHLDSALKNGTWAVEIPGRLILKRFVEAHVHGVRYSAFRNLIVELMKREEFCPEGMRQVLSDVLAT